MSYLKKGESPYVRLKERFIAYIKKVENRDRRLMFFFAKDKIDAKTGYRLDNVAERVAAAQELGYVVEIRYEDGNLRMEYVKKIPKEYVY